MIAHMQGYDHWLGMGPFGGWLTILLAVLAVIAVAWLVASLLRRGSGGPGAAAGGLDEADAILRARLARGEISAEEYAETRRVLGLK
jgi:uncharacterized membrane protein